MKKRWELISNRRPDNLEEIKRTLLGNREIKNREEFFTPPKPSDLIAQSAKYFSDLDQDQLNRAVSRIKTAIQKGEMGP